MPLESLMTGLRILACCQVRLIVARLCPALDAQLAVLLR